MNAELVDVNIEERTKLQFEKLHEEAENQKLLKQVGYEANEKGGSQGYVKEGIFPE
jgi:hypothetical protein